MNHQDYKKVLQTNPKIDIAKLEKYLKFRDFIKKAGISSKPDYNIAPNLGPSKISRSSMPREITWQISVYDARQ